MPLAGPIMRGVVMGPRVFVRGATVMNSRTRRRFLQQMAAGVGAGCMGWHERLLSGAQDPAVDLSKRLCICNELFGDWPFEKAFGLAAECGYQGLEIAPFTVDNDVRRVAESRRREIRRTAERAGLDVVGLHWLLAKTEGFHLTSPDWDVRRKTAGYLGDLARFCADLGGELLVFGSPKQRNLLPGVAFEQAMRFAADVIGQTLPVFEKTGVTLALEPLSPRTTNFINTTAQAVQLVELVDSPRCRLILDCLAMSHESKPIADIIRANRVHVAHFHANDPNAQGPGFGDLDFVPILRALREIDYGGWISVEVFDYSPGREQLARKSAEYMRQCLAE
jgi:sugar phosphate isomerase/epimerase